ncbi:MAG: thiamine phosphate synthase [Desulfobacterales bacterium]|nr:thiamine phosphate synthase [Desulfobacterales bacterium]
MKNKKSFFSTQKRNIYCFADTLPLCKELLNAGAKIIQLRNKHLDDSAFFDLATAMLAQVKSCNDAILIINDRVDIALEIGADGIHIGQEDESYHRVISRMPTDMIVGVSVNCVDEALEAQKAGADYVGAGAVFPTSTKPDADLISLEELNGIVQAISIPVVALGGISIDNIHQVMETGAQYYGIISEINNAEDISARFNQFFNILVKGK